MESEKELDLFALVQYFWRYKWIPIVIGLVCLAGSWGYYRQTTVARYFTSIQIRLPQYCSDKDYNTAVTIARSTQLMETTQERLQRKDRPGINPSRINGTSIIRVNLDDLDPERVFAFANTYMKVLTEELDSFVNEQFVHDLQINMGKNASPTALAGLEQQIKLQHVKVVQEPILPEKPSFPNHTMNIIKTAFYGLFIGLLIVGARFLHQYFTFR